MLEVKPLDSVVSKGVRSVSMANRNNMCVVSEDLVSDWINIFPRIILRKHQLDQVRLLEWLSIDRILVMLYKPSYYIFVVEYETICRTDWGVERLQT